MTIIPFLPTSFHPPDAIQFAQALIFNPLQATFMLGTADLAFPFFSAAAFYING